LLFTKLLTNLKFLFYNHTYSGSSVAINLLRFIVRVQRDHIYLMYPSALKSATEIS